MEIKKKNNKRFVFFPGMENCKKIKKNEERLKKKQNKTK